MRGRPHFLRNRRGVAMIFVAVAILALVGLLALAVDIGRVRVAKTDLQVATDAAARAAAYHVRGDLSVARDKAVAVAAENTCLGDPVALDWQSDIIFGHWYTDSRRFVAGGAPLNAAQVTAHRDSARSSAVPMAFASVVGKSSMDVQATATAVQLGGRTVRWGIVGIDSISMTGIASTDSYDSTKGIYSRQTPGDHGDTLSNGSYSQTGNVVINGVASYVAGQNPPINATGGVEEMDAPQEFPKVDPGNAAYLNDNAKIATYLDSKGNLTISGNRGITLPAGTYFLHDLTMTGNAQLFTAGQVKIYVTGEVSLQGTVESVSHQPADVRIEVIGPGPVDMGGTSQFTVDLYAPEAAVKVNGTPDFFGALVGKTLEVIGTAAIHYDESLGRQRTTPVRIKLVK